MSEYISFEGKTFRPTTDEWSDYYIGLHDFETPVWNYRPRSLYAPDDGLIDKYGYPEMIPLIERRGMELTGSVLWFLFDLCLTAQYGYRYGSAGWDALTREQKNKAASEFETFYDSKRFISNHSGIDVNYNPIGEAILGQSHRSGIARQWDVFTGGNIVKAISHTPVMKLATDDDGIKRNIPCIQIEVWDGVSPTFDELLANGEKYRHLIHWATIATPFGYDHLFTKTGPWRVDPFPFFSGRAPYMLYCSSPNYVPLNRVRRLRVAELAATSPMVP